MPIKYLFFSFLATAFATGCYYDVEETLYPSTGPCITADLSYKTDIVPILDNSCMVCHSNAANLGNVSLEGYDNLKVYVTNGKLLGSIKHESGYSAMPAG